MSNSSLDVVSLNSETVFCSIKPATISAASASPGGSGAPARRPLPAKGGSQNSAESITAAPSRSAAKHCSRTDPRHALHLVLLLSPPPVPSAAAATCGCSCCPPPSFPMARALTHGSPPLPPEGTGLARSCARVWASSVVASLRTQHGSAARTGEVQIGRAHV